MLSLVTNLFSRELKMLNKSSVHERDLCDRRVKQGTVFYDGYIPDFVELELELLYESPFTTITRFRQYRTLLSLNTYVAYYDYDVTAIIIFDIVGDEAQVLNEQISLAASRITCFSRSVFESYPMVNKVRFYAIETNAEDILLPRQSLKCLDDIRLLLPSTSKKYQDMLGRSTAEYIRKAPSRVARECPTFSFEFEVGAAIDEATVRTIIKMNGLRMTEKNRESYHTEESITKLLELVTRYGRVGVGRIDSKVCGGVILLQVGSKYYLHTLSHNPIYNRLRLGYLFCYYGIEFAIDSGGKEFHFGWGRYDYKYKLLGQNCDLSLIVLYRNRLRLTLDCMNLLRRKIISLRHLLLIAAEERTKSSSLLIRFATANLKCYRLLKKKIRSLAVQ